jgi:hypothetical protein
MGLWPTIPVPAPAGFTDLPAVYFPLVPPKGWNGYPPPVGDGEWPPRTGLPGGDYWLFAWDFMFVWRMLCLHRRRLSLSPGWPTVDISDPTVVETHTVNRAVADFVESYNSHKFGTDGSSGDVGWQGLPSPFLLMQSRPNSGPSTLRAVTLSADTTVLEPSRDVTVRFLDVGEITGTDAEFLIDFYSTGSPGKRVASLKVHGYNYVWTNYVNDGFDSAIVGSIVPPTEGWHSFRVVCADLGPGDHGYSLFYDDVLLHTSEYSYGAAEKPIEYVNLTVQARGDGATCVVGIDKIAWSPNALEQFADYPLGAVTDNLAKWLLMGVTGSECMVDIVNSYGSTGDTEPTAHTFDPIHGVTVDDLEAEGVAKLVRWWGPTGGSCRAHLFG